MGKHYSPTERRVHDTHLTGNWFDSRTGHDGEGTKNMFFFLHEKNRDGIVYYHVPYFYFTLQNKGFDRLFFCFNNQNNFHTVPQSTHDKIKVTSHSASQKILRLLCNQKKLTSVPPSIDHWILPWARWNQFTLPHPIFPSSILILYSQLRPGHPRILFH
jgi:hypothetical protein